MRGYLIDGSVVFLDTMRAGADEAHSDLAQIQRHFAENPAQQARMKRVGLLIESYFEQIDETVAVRRQHGTVAAVAQMLKSQPVIVEALAELDEARQVESDLMTERRARSDSETRFALRMVTVGSAGLALLVAGAAFIAVRASRERDAAEAGLRAAHAQLAATHDAAKEQLADLARSISDGLWVVDQDDRFIFVNPQAGRLLGKPEQDWLGKQVGDLFAEPAFHFSALLASVRRSGSATTIETHWGERDRWFETRFYPRAGTVTALSSDVTERRNIQAELKRSRDTIEAVLEGSTDAIFVKDRAGRYLHANSTCAGWLGLEREALIGRDDAVLFPAADLPPIRDVDRRVIESGQTLTFEETVALPARGTRSFLTTKGPLRDAAGVVQGLFGVARDITERKRDEVQLRELSARLLRVQEEERRVLAHELHDEVGQQLAALKLNLQTLARTVPGNAAAARIGDCIEIVDGAIDQVRDRALSLRPSMLDDIGLAAALDWYCRRQSERSGTEISLEIEALTQALPEPIPITAFRIVQEAVNNAIRYAQAAHIEVSLRNPDHAIELVVQDDGRGFDPSALDPRRDDSLGLVGMRQRVSWLGGEIDIASASGSGTRVRALLPLKETAT